MSVPDENLTPASSFGQSFVVEGATVRYWPAPPGQGARFDAGCGPDRVFQTLREIGFNEPARVTLGAREDWSPIRFADGPVALVNVKLRLFSWQVAPAPQVKNRLKELRDELLAKLDPPARVPLDSDEELFAAKLKQEEESNRRRGLSPLGVGVPNMLSTAAQMREYNKLLASDRRYSPIAVADAPDVPEEFKNDPKARALFEEWSRRRSSVIAAQNQFLVTDMGIPVRMPGRSAVMTGIPRRREPEVVSGPRKYFDE